MLALAAIGFALVVGLASGGNLSGLLQSQLKQESMLIVLFAAQAVARGPLADRYLVAGLVVWGAVSLVLLCILLVHAKWPGLGVAAVGVALNAVVVLSNGGMPAGGSDYFDAGALSRALAVGFYEPITKATHVAWLGDVIPAGTGLASLGDILLVVGVAVFLLELMLQPQVVE